MLIFSIFIQFIFLINCSVECWFFEHIFSNDLSTKWFNYKKTFKKFYSNDHENSLRKSIFEKNFNFINKLNEDFSKGLISFKAELNAFADLTTEEFLKQKTGLIFNNETLKINRLPTKIRRKRDTFYLLPEHKDWRESKNVSPVKDQGLCGSCYAFATVSSLESFNVQELLDCSVFYNKKKIIGGNCNGCNGGTLSCVFEYVKRKGLTDFKQVQKLASSSSSFSFTKEKNLVFKDYRGVEGTCKGSNEKALINEFANYYKNVDEEDIQFWLYLYGPIAIGINGSPKSFHFYKSGIYDDPSCGYGETELNHAVLLVGYGSENGRNYWIIKNSYGVSWGENGFMRILRGHNLCGIETYGAFPYD